ncbi:hypothetical protein SYNPS1DRAFT_28685 [Syncephalis pseudoplumigaleata]|uniref:NADH dehydrogenase [ubiquinone] 1 alpha subcomplex subunit 7 n=1 Tax=Syncephalis pseudoplumigaleata TaxID=1712513 RepID=A0A4P9Z1F8_9FUNG|nr:hypothetical protein SYNPS1DRAFT_28685 [Syncephalis pseudoplumigaleata]|eukprot:RKP25581.1 hypothetical protein SYNPS1DRAFT_28685 [Syncephalis pseudoplumigaleata]
MSSSSSFWRNLKRLLVINPELSESMPPKDYRMPSPGSQPETYKEPVTGVSNISDNYYYQRDTRRAYPRLLTVSQADLAKRIAAPSEGALEAPDAAKSAAESTALAETPAVPLAEAILQAKGPLYSADRLPPVPGKPYKWKMATHVTPAPENVYWPVYYVQ